MAPWREQSRRRDIRDKCAKIETVRHMDTKEQRRGRGRRRPEG